MNFEQRVYDKEFKLNDTDDSIVEYIREHKDGIINISIQQVATELFVAPNTVMRLAKKLGYSGFSELKYALQSEVSTTAQPTQNKTITSQIFDKLPKNIAKTLDILHDEDILEMVKNLKRAKKILFVGVGDSVYFCQLFGRYLRCLDKHVEFFAQIHDIEYSARQYGKDDMIVFISASGQTVRLVELAKQCKKQGTLLYCMTHYGENSLSLICDKQLCFWGEKRIVNGYNVTDYVGLMILIRMTCECFWKEFTDDT